MTTDSNEEGTRALMRSAQLETVEQMLEQERFMAELCERRFVIIDETWQIRTYQLGLIEQLKRQFKPVKVERNDPRPTKGKFEPPHLFNSRLRDWLRRNP